MLKFKKIKIEGFKSRNSSIEVNFSKEQSSVIYGDNGCGKTTFLKIIHGILSQNESMLMNEEVNSILIEYYFTEDNIEIINTITIDKLPEQEDIDDDNDPFERIEETFYDWSEFEGSHLLQTKSISLAVDRGSSSTKSNVTQRSISDFLNRRRHMRSFFRSVSDIRDFSYEFSEFLKNRATHTRSTNLSRYEDDHVFLKEINMDNVSQTLHARYKSARRNAARRVQNALFDTLALAIKEQEGQPSSLKEKIPNNFNELIFNNKDIIIEALDDSLENSFKDTIVNELMELNSIGDVLPLRDNPLLSKLLLKMSEQLNNSDDELSAVNIIIDKFDLFTAEGKSIKIDINNIEINSNTGIHSISELSSGERHILTLLTLLLDQGRNRNFIIIDEPEISLNTKWQEVLLSTLSEILPYSQIIVASHSPLISPSIDNLVELETL